MQSFQNLGVAVITMLAGVIVDRMGYLVLEVFFILCVSSKYHHTHKHLVPMVKNPNLLYISTVTVA